MDINTTIVCFILAFACVFPFMLGHERHYEEYDDE